MNCQKFEFQMESFLAKRLPSTSMRECLAHLESCAACGELLDLMQREFIRPDPAQSEELVQAVLGKTIGKSCSQAHELLPDHVDGVLPGVQRALLERHLEHCSSCQKIHAILIEFKEDLPNLAEMDPGRGFSWRVMQATRQADRLTPHESFWSNQIWHRLLYRPRVAWEVAYTITLLLFAFSRLLIFFTGWPSLESISSLQAKPAQVWISTASGVKRDLVKCSMSLAVKQDRWISVSGESRNQFSKTMIFMACKSEQCWKSASNAVLQMQNTIRNGFANQIDDIWPKGGPESRRLSPKKETH
jgi:hypothetical protein